MINKVLYQTIGLGGTFDHFHSGHQSFINFASSLAHNLVIGVTNEKMALAKPYKQTIQPLYIRLNNIKKYCQQKNIKAKVIQLNDPFGPTVDNKLKIQALACTRDTVKGAEKINEVRNKIRLRKLPIHSHKLLLDKQKRTYISSSRIRAGEIDKEGNLMLFIQNKNLKTNSLVLTTQHKQHFTKVKGELIHTPNNQDNFTVLVGDKTLETFINNHWHYNLTFFDGKQQRVITQSQAINKLTISQTLTNQAGTINQMVINFLLNYQKEAIFDQSYIKSVKNIYIKGEEDLVAVASILTLPLGTYIYYGQPNKGLVEIKLTSNLKHQVFSILNK